MKLRTFIITFGLLIPRLLLAQPYIAGDAILKRLNDSLPTGWTMNINGDKLAIVRTDTIYTIMTNHINEPVERNAPTKEEVKERFEKYGHKEKLTLYYRIEPIWSNEKMKQAKKHNDSIYHQVDKLKDKYNIKPMFLPEKGKSFNPDSPYRPKTKDDTVRLAKFKEEEALLNSLLVTVPREKTEKYYLFNTEYSCYGGHYNFEFLDIYPTEANSEMFRICTLISTFCEIKNK